MLLSKTDFLIFCDCAHNAWLKVHKPEVYEATPPSVFEQNLMGMGNDVDALARNLFPGGVLIARGESEHTARLIRLQTPVLYQPVFETNRYKIACDILVWNDHAAAYDLFEVKASTRGDKSYAYDLAFQAAVLRENGIPLGRLFLVHLNGNYERRDELDVSSLFALVDYSEQVAHVRNLVADKMAEAYDCLQSDHELPPPCGCLRKGRSAHCTTFAHTNPTVPEYGVHDISRLSRKKLGELVDRNIFAIEKVPDDFELSDAQRNQVLVARTGLELVDIGAIERFVAGAQYPIAFLDYETYPCAIPRFDGYRPYDQIPFQFSLHVIQRPGDEPTHEEFLFTQTDSPDSQLLAALQLAMPDSGSVIAWNKNFESGINSRLAERNLAARAFLQEVNQRLVDLMDVFSSQAYVDPNFRGKTSIKKILTVLVPSLSYDTLEIREGATATARWNDIVTGKVDSTKAAKIRLDLLRYCALDTRAMVEIWRTLIMMISRGNCNQS